ncbi:MAG: hypothetical protein KGO05_09505 [Chloroflexota bacterium]|nr:hypothetical protein [Chloroflexota bacterium]
MAQEYPKAQVQTWGLPVGLALIIGAIALTFYANVGAPDTTTTIIGIIALPMLGAGITSLGSFIYSLIRRGVYKHEVKLVAATHQR